MLIDPVVEWRRLSEHYRSLGDEELRELARDFADLTDTAQQALSAEMSSRKLGSPEKSAQAWNAEPVARTQAESVAPHDEEEGADGPLVDYTWKTLLCECDTGEQAWQISEMLRQAGIESWIDGPGQYSPHRDLDMTNPRVLVAADELDRARLIAARPVPKEIVEESQMTGPEFEMPMCPRCGASDPTLEEAEPVNRWKCESCGSEWTDPEPGEDGKSTGA
jgi:ribosomal protein S27AE